MHSPGVVTLQRRLALVLERAANFRRAVAQAYGHPSLDVTITMAGLDEVLDNERAFLASWRAEQHSSAGSGAQGDPATLSKGGLGQS